MQDRQTFRARPVHWLIALGLLLPLGCLNRDAPFSTPTQDPPPFSESGDAFMPDRWWTSLANPQLNAQVERTLGGNFTLASALEQLRAAQAVVRREASDLWPDLDGVSDYERLIRTDGENGGALSLGLSVSYQVDLWGQIEARVDAQRFRAAATHADYHAVALTLAAEVASAWCSLIEANAQLELLEEQIETNRTGLELQEARFGLGQIRAPDVLRQRQLLESTLEQRVVVQSRVEVLEHLLAVLEGRPPQDASYDAGSTLPDVPPLPATGLSSELLNRRPDVRRDFLAFRAADRELAAAISSLYPRLNLAASLRSATERPEDLFRDWFLSMGSQVVGPILDGGQRRAEIDRTSAVVRQRFNDYGQTVLIAFREVEDSLARERYQLQRIDRLNRQVTLARQASLQLREQYLIQEADYLDVLSAIQQEQRLQRETLSARLDLLLIRIGLYLALAGSFNTQPQPVQLDGADANGIGTELFPAAEITLEPPREPDVNE